MDTAYITGTNRCSIAHLEAVRKAGHMDDVLDRLRRAVSAESDGPRHINRINAMMDAVDEIKRLQAQVARLTARLQERSPTMLSTDEQ
jgi:ubiquinone biosynthesis protein UbiJ